jgi:hypothetical protein
MHCGFAIEAQRDAGQPARWPSLYFIKYSVVANGAAPHF